MNIRLLSFFLASALLPAVVAQEISTVKTVAPAKATKASAFEVPGRTEPIESATIFTRATGIVKERRFEIGDVVKPGDVLAIVDAPEIDRAVEAAKAGVDQTMARAANSQNLSDRSSKLLKSEVVSKEETEQRQLAAVEMAAGVRVAQAELARLEEQQRFSIVRAPFEGVISARNFDRGDHVRGDAASAEGFLYRINRLDTLRFVVNATPDLALRLGGGGEARVRFGEFPGREFSAKLAHASRIFDLDSGTMRVELLLENKDMLLPAGLTGTATFQVNPTQGTYLVPTNALVVREGKNMVMIVEDGKVRFVKVLPGRNFGRDIEVASDQLSEAAAVVLNPNAMLREGDAVSAAPLTASK